MIDEIEKELFSLSDKDLVEELSKLDDASHWGDFTDESLQEKIKICQKIAIDRYELLRRKINELEIIIYWK